jgi:hypothetical protein
MISTKLAHSCCKKLATISCIVRNHAQAIDIYVFAFMVVPIVTINHMSNVSVDDEQVENDLFRFGGILVLILWKREIPDTITKVTA